MMLISSYVPQTCRLGFDQIGSVGYATCSDKGKDLSDCIIQIAEDRATLELLDFHELAESTRIRALASQSEVAGCITRCSIAFARGRQHS